MQAMPVSVPRALFAVITAVTMQAACAQAGAGALPQLAPRDSLGLALGIATVPNLRDVGGYKTADGATVARGLAYRSDTFNPMSAGASSSTRASASAKTCSMRAAKESRNDVFTKPFP